MPVVETVTFRTIHGTTAQDLRDAWQKSHSFTRAQPGFQSRRLLKHTEDAWVDLIEWDSMESALQAERAFNPVKFPDLIDLAMVIDQNSLQMHHYEIIDAAA